MLRLGAAAALRGAFAAAVGLASGSGSGSSAGGGRYLTDWVAMAACIPRSTSVCGQLTLLNEQPTLAV